MTDYLFKTDEEYEQKTPLKRKEAPKKEPSKDVPKEPVKKEIPKEPEKPVKHTHQCNECDHMFVHHHDPAAKAKCPVCGHHNVKKFT